MGHEVNVLTVEKDETAPDKLLKSNEKVKVTEIPVGPFVRRLRQNRRLARLGFERRFKGSSWRNRLSESLKLRGVLSSVRLPDIFDFVLPAASRWMNGTDGPKGLDWIVSSFGPHASLAMGYLAKQSNPRAKWVIDFRDLWVGNHVYSGIWPITVIERCLERFYINRSDLVVTVSSALANELRSRYPAKKIVVSHNGFDPEEVKSANGVSEDSQNDRFTFVYTGSLHPTQRNPRPLLEALSQTSKDFRKKILFKFAGPKAEFLDQLITKYQLEDCVQILGKLAREESLRLQREADVLLFLESQRDEARDGVLTGKLFEYLITGRPIWAVGIEEGSTVGRLLTSGDAGFAFGNDVPRILRYVTDAERVGRVKSRDVTVPTDISQQFNRIKLAEELLIVFESMDS